MPELMVDLVRLRMIVNGLASLANKASSIQRGVSSASPDPAVAGRHSIGARLTRANQRMIKLERRLRSVQTFTAQAAGQYDAAAAEVERRAVIEHGTSVVMKRYAGAAGGASGKTLSPEQLAALSLLGQLALAAVQGSMQGPAMLGAMVAGGGASRKNSGSQGLYIPDHVANEVLGSYTEDEHSAYVYKLPDGTVLPVDVNKASELIGQFNQISNEQIMGYAEVMTGYSEAIPAFLAFAAEQGYDVRTFMPDGHSAINDYYIQLRSGDIAFYEEAYAKPFREQLLQGASTASDLIPIIGTIKGVFEVVSGRDPVTGNSLSAGERTISAVFTLASLLPVTGIMKTAFKPFTKNADAVPDIVKQVDEIGIGGMGDLNYKKISETPAEDVNKWWKEEMGYSEPPYKPGTLAQEIELTEKSTFVRVYDGENSGMYGGWFMKADDIKGLTPSQIQDKFALPSTPKFVVDLELDAGTKIRTGTANPLFGFEGGGQQFDLLGQRVGNFTNPRPLP